MKLNSVSINKALLEASHILPVCTVAFVLEWLTLTSLDRNLMGLQSLKY